MGLGEVSTRIESPIQPAQPLPVAQMSARQMYDDAGSLQTFDGFGEEALGELVVGQQGSRARQNT